MEGCGYNYLDQCWFWPFGFLLFSAPALGFCSWRVYSWMAMERSEFWKQMPEGLTKKETDALLRKSIAMVMASMELKKPHVGVVFEYVFVDWLTKRMTDLYFQQPTPFKPIFMNYHKPLHYCSVEVIDGRHYKLELRKVPLVYLLEELTVTWLPELDAVQPPPGICTLFAIDNDLCDPRGFYRVTMHLSKDHQYLERLIIKRI